MTRLKSIRVLNQKIKDRLSSRNSETLVLTILVKNEADIIIDNVFFHYAVGVDKVIITDNGSSDGTLEILKDLEAMGLVYLLEESGYHQTKWVNKMADVAKQEYNATVLIHTDADEFWRPTEYPTLKDAYARSGKPHFVVERYNILPDITVIHEDFPQDKMNLIYNRIEAENIINESRSRSIYTFRLTPKLMFSIRDKIRHVTKGSHQLQEEHVEFVYDGVETFHFPLKSSKRFEEKVKMASEAINEIREIKSNKETSWHWKRFVERYREGMLAEEIKLQVSDLESIREVKTRKFDYQAEIVGRIKGNTKLLPKYLEITKKHRKCNT